MQLCIMHSFMSAYLIILNILLYIYVQEFKVVFISYRHIYKYKLNISE